jgi:hypothetical protein
MRLCTRKIFVVVLLTVGCGDTALDQQPGEEIPISGGSISSTSGGQVSSRAISGAPTMLAVRPSTPVAIEITWTDAAVNELIYEIERCSGTDCIDFLPVSRSPLASNTTSYTEEGLSPATIYRFRVRTTNRNGSSAWVLSENISTLMLPNTAIAASESTASSIALTWASTPSSYTSVEIERCEGVDCLDYRPTFNSPYMTSAKSTHTEPGLAVATIYRFRIRSVSDTTATSWL